MNRRCWLWVVLVWLSPCLAGAQTPLGERLSKIFDDDWEMALRESPVFASHLGDKRYNDRWPDLSLAAIQRRHEHQQQRLKSLVAMESYNMSPTDRLNYSLFRRQVEMQLAEFPYQWHLAPLDHRSGIQDESDVASALSFTTVKDYEDWIARLKTLPVLVDQTIELMRTGIRAGVVQPKIVMRRIPAQVRRQIVEDPTTSLYYKPFRSMSAEIPASDAERLKRQAQAAIREQVVPAYRKFLGFFDREYFPACLDDIGALRLPNGQEFYAHLARKHTTTSLTPNEIHDIGQSEVRRIRSEMEKIREKVAFQGTLAEFFEHLRTAPQYRYTDANDLLTAYQAFSKRVDPLLPPLFRKLPRIPYGVEAIPEHMAPDTTTAYYRPPAADGTRAGTYFVNLYKPEKRPKYEIAALSLHEAVPGHHLQIALATELENVPEFRKHTHFTAYIEGWALYAESLGDEMHLYDDPYSKMGQLTYEMWRAIRLVVDTGMHSKGWSRDQAIQFFKDNSPKDELDITNEIDRYIAWPGQALAYKIGELKIKELRARAKTKLGARFDIREFHDVILREGALPLDVLEKNVDAWLEGKQ
jgi:prolyl oligopeptidase